MSGFLTGDAELDDARAELLNNDRSTPPALLGGTVAAAAAETAQNQHVADEVNAAARRAYLEIPEGVMAKLTPFDEYTVVEMLTQVVAGQNYFFKVRIADDEFIQIRVHVSLFGDPPQLVALRKGTDAQGNLGYFEAG